MDPKHRQIINSNAMRLTGMLDLKLILPLLEEKKIFNSMMIEDICKQGNESSNLFFMFNELVTRGPDAFKLFVEILVETNQMEAALILEPNLPISNGNIAEIVSYGGKIYEGDVIYKMTSNPRGYCLIINNYYFDDKRHREGSDLDLKKFFKLFTEIGYNCIVEEDKTAVEMETILEEFSQKPEHRDVDSTVVIIMSHGDKDIIYGIDNMSLSEEKLLSYFNNNRCENLKGKPKIFFIQACRGLDLDIGAYEVADSKPVNRKLIPSLSDTVVFYPTLPNYSAIRNIFCGSWLCNAVVKIFSVHAKDTELAHMLNKVSKDISEKTTCDGFKTTPEAIYKGVYKSIYFNPGRISSFNSLLEESNEVDNSKNNNTCCCY